VLRTLVAAGRPVTLTELTDTLGGHPNTTRAQLEHLVSDGFAVESLRPGAGRGRPARTYTATIAGRQVALEDPDRDGQPALIEAVAEHLVASGDPVEAAHSLGRGWGRRLAEAEGSDLAGMLAAQGFTPERTEDGLALRTCPLLDSATRWPDVVCAIHQGLIDAVAPEPQQLLPFAVPGACLVRPQDRVATTAKLTASGS
jgi:predicted ArsR family transcriptional regulator